MSHLSWSSCDPLCSGHPGTGAALTTCQMTNWVALSQSDEVRFSRRYRLGLDR